MRCATIITVIALTVSGSAFAAGQDDGFVMNKTGKRFYALPVDGGGAGAGGGIKLRSDAQAAKQGFIVLNRAKDTVPKSISTVRNAQQNDKDVLSLFENELSKTAGAPIPPSRVAYRWPLPANTTQHVSSGFGVRGDPFSGRSAFHGGVDIAAPAGTPILAAASGRVTASGYNKGFGNSITILHPDGSETMYNHLSKAEIRVGSIVRQGQEIGKLGSTGRSTGPHLDFRISENGSRIDPMIRLASVKPAGTAVASRAPARTTARVVRNGPNVRQQNGVRIISPQQRVAMSGGFIQVR